MKRFSNHSRKKGFTLLIAVLVSSIFLSLASTIATITFKQIILSSIGKDSQRAFYAADAGMECALYWDLKFSDPHAEDGEENGSAFPVQETDAGGGASDLGFAWPGEASCNGQDIAGDNAPLGNIDFDNNGSGDTAWHIDDSSPQRNTTTFRYSLGTQPSDPCVVVEVKKEKTGIPLVDISTEITSRGYNTCNPSSRQIERALEATFYFPEP